MSKIWKWLFLGLLALNLALVSVVTYRIMTPVETTSSVSLPKGATKIGKYSMTKDELDAALTGFAQDYSTDKMRFKVKVTNSKIVFESSYKVLGHPVPLYVYFTPVVSESGAIVLHVSELSAGTLKLPVSDVLKMINRSTNLPDYIAIDSKKGKVTLNIQKDLFKCHCSFIQGYNCVRGCDQDKKKAIRRSDIPTNSVFLRMTSSKLLIIVLHS